MVARRLPASHPGEGLKLRPEYPTLSSHPVIPALCRGDKPRDVSAAGTM